VRPRASTPPPRPLLHPSSLQLPAPSPLSSPPSARACWRAGAGGWCWRCWRWWLVLALGARGDKGLRSCDARRARRAGDRGSRGADRKRSRPGPHHARTKGEIQAGSADQRISGGRRSHGLPGAKARRKQCEEPTTGHKGNWRVSCSCLRVETLVVAHRCLALSRSFILCGCIHMFLAGKPMRYGVNTPLAHVRCV
jgi:hypothetical protein